MTTTLLPVGQDAAVKLLSPPALHVKALLPEYVSEAQALLSVTILCSGDGAGAEAAHFTKFLAQKLGPDVDFQANYWTFDELQHLRSGMVATELAEQTHVLILVAEELQELPVSVRKWIVGWLNQARPWYAFVCLVGSRDGRSMSAVCQCLRNACEQARVSFFLSSFRTRVRPTSASRASRAITPKVEPPFGVAHWGINE